MKYKSKLGRRSEGRASLVKEPEISGAVSTESKSEYVPGPCRPGLCKGDAACYDGSKENQPGKHKCVCPSDFSTHYSEDTLCGRKVVAASPRPILNIIPPSAVNATSLGNSTKFPETEKIPEILVAQPLGAVMIALMSSVVISVVIVVAVCWWKRKFLTKCAMKGQYRKHDTEASPLSLSKGLLGNYVSNPQYTAGTPTLAMPVPVLPRETLVYVQEIGEGCFGKVFKGQLHCDEGTVETVAVKVLKDGASKQAEEDFMREVEIMSTFRHENILTLLGIVLKEPGCRPWMVFEYMPYGDLAEVLRSNSKQLWKPVPGLEPLTKNSLLWIALQVAGGMRYLAAQRFVHNDLACRNCLVGNGLSVKIADFGMSRDVYTCDYYRIGGSRPVPLRWMSPESVMYRRFTLESDVWSFGVVLWEIYSLGKQPYYGLNNEEVVKLILQGIMLIPPDGCPPLICDLMRACWKTEPKDRIRFPDIWDKLGKAWDLAQAPVTSPKSLPRPPIMPVGHISENRREEAELLDADNYLAPNKGPIAEYFQPIPD